MATAGLRKRRELSSSERLRVLPFDVSVRITSPKVTMTSSSFSKISSDTIEMIRLFRSSQLVKLNVVCGEINVEDVKMVKSSSSAYAYIVYKCEH